MRLRQTLGVAGAVLLGFGVFAPLMRAPIVGDLNYFSNGRGDGSVVLVLAAASLALALVKRYQWLLLTGSTVFAMLVGTFLRVQNGISGMRADAERDLADNPFRGIADAAINAFQMQWGWAILAMGAGLLIAAALVKEQSRRRKCPHCAELIQPDAVLCRYCNREVGEGERTAVADSGGVDRRVVVATTVAVFLVIVVMWREPLLIILIRNGIL